MVLPLGPQRAQVVPAAAGRRLWQPPGQHWRGGGCGFRRELRRDDGGQRCTSISSDTSGRLSGGCPGRQGGPAGGEADHDATVPNRDGNHRHTSLGNGWSGRLFPASWSMPSQGALQSDCAGVEGQLASGARARGRASRGSPGLPAGGRGRRTD